MTDVAIIGVGLHPFGRFGDKPGMEMEAEAIMAALDDAGVEWGDVQFVFGGSLEVMNPDAVTRLVGLTGIPFTDVFNACRTVASAIQQTADTIRLGKYDLGVAVGMDKHPRGAFTAPPSMLGLPDWYGETGQFLTTKFFGMKANRYLHDHDISTRTLAKVAAKNYRNGSLNPNAFRRTPMSEDDILDSPVLNYPLTQYMFCVPDEGAAAVVMCRVDIAHRYTDHPVYVKATEIRTRRFGADQVHATSAPVDEDVSPTVYVLEAAFETAGLGPDDVDVIQLDTDAGAEGLSTWPRPGSAPMVSRRSSWPTAPPRSTVRCPSTLTGSHRQRRAHRRLRPASGPRARPPAARRGRRPAGSGHAEGRVRPGYGAPGTAAATILTT